MTLKSVVRRGALVAVATATAATLAACGAGQISQTANQVAAVDGAQNSQAAVAGGVAIRDAHILVNPEKNTAALKFSASNEERATESVYTVESIEIDGIGNVELTKVAETASFKKLAQGDKSIPRECQLVVDSADTIKKISNGVEGNSACIAYYSTNLDASTLVGENGTAAGENRNATFKVKDQNGKEETIELVITVSADIVDAGVNDRDEQGLVKNEK